MVLRKFFESVKNISWNWKSLFILILRNSYISLLFTRKTPIDIGPRYVPGLPGLAFSRPKNKFGLF